MQRFVDGCWNEEDFLIVPPGQRIAEDVTIRGLSKPNEFPFRLKNGFPYFLCRGGSDDLQPGNRRTCTLVVPPLPRPFGPADTVRSVG
jgi:hypothetical protein